MSRLLSWLPPVVWMVVILVFSSGSFSGAHTASVLEPLLRWLLPSLSPAQIEIVHVVIRKTTHLTVYGLLAGLWLRAFVRERTLPLPAAVWAAFAISVAWACVDELHQSTVPSRKGTPADVAVDAVGAAVVLISARARQRWQVRHQI